MTEPKYDLAEMKKIGMIQLKNKEYFAMRLRAVGGDLTVEQLRKIADVAEKYGEGYVHLSTRQGVEIHGVFHENIETARGELEQAGIRMGACGPRVRVVVACPGNAYCKWGSIETKEIAKYLDKTYFKVETPHKFKMGVTGCPHNCAKASENDVGVMGAILPEWLDNECIDCNLCVNVCPTKAIERKEVKDESGELKRKYILNEDKCINCSICTSACPTSAWVPEKQGYNLYIGGTMGKMPRLGSILKKLITEEEELYSLIDSSLRYYQKHGRKKERFGHTIDRIGLEQVRKEILNEANN